MKNIKLSSPWFGPEEIEAATRVLSCQKVNMGNEVKQFETELLDFFCDGNRRCDKQDLHVECVNSCTAALQLVLQAEGIKSGDEVLVPTYTFVSTFQAISATGAKPIPCDIDLDDGFIDLDDASSRVTPRTTAIVPVLFAGCDSKLEQVRRFAAYSGFALVVDAAHCFGNDGLVRSGITMCFSFDAIKNISCTDGGAMVTSYQPLADKVKDLRLLGVVGDTDKRFSGQRSWDFDVVEQGWRYHMNDLCAAIGRAQLSKFPMLKDRRRSHARTYMERLSNVPGIRLFPIDIERAVPHIFPIIITNGRRDELKEFLAENGIETGIQYKPNHLLTYYKPKYDLPKAMQLYESILSIPVHPMLTDEEVVYIAESIESFMC